MDKTSNFASYGILGFLVFIVLMKFIDKWSDKKVTAYRKVERRAERGAKAEETVASILGNLEGDYALLHDVDTGYGDIDHIILSKEHGVFLIETKSHHGDVTASNGKLFINNQLPEKDFISQTLRNMMWLKKRIKERTGLDVWIQPVIVFTNAFVREWNPIKGNLLRNKKYLIETIVKAKSNYSHMERLWVHYHEGKLF